MKGKKKTLNQEEETLTNVFKQKKKLKRRSSKEEEKANRESQEEEAEEDKGKGGGGFYACYLLTSLSPRHKGHTYIGFAVNPRRRIRQHNGEIGSGAWRTKRRRPWEMVLCIYGFPTNVSALQFEWAWQHPLESVAVRQAAAAPAFKSLSGVANKIKLAYTMLTLPPWHTFNITLNYFSTKYTNHSAACPPLPNHIKVKICPMDSLPCYNQCLPEEEEEEQYRDDDDDLDECNEASNAADEHYEQTRLLGGGISDSVDPSSPPPPPPLINTSVEMETPLPGPGRIDVVDLLTPSPDCTKRTRVSPEIIDLTFT